MDAFERSLNDLLLDTFNNIIKYEEISLKKMIAPVTISEAHTIEAISKLDGRNATVGNLAALLNIAAPTVTVAVKKLESKGLVRKTQCEKDARRAIVSLTDAGRRIERAHRLFHERMVRNIGRQFAESEKEVLLRAIQMLSEFFKARTAP